ncbi:Bug family tripartite tricarboxylate transporter substrate binding protein [Alcaligenes sp. 13f]|uniref:Bug family tripartite tricarboxylate transporter substrate binding protein n=1 Tax=Alcaligenes sp. 13f TaxID=2841924 RepID=UPI0039A5A26B
MPYDGVNSFTIIGGITANPAVLAISTHIPATNFAQFNAYAKSRTGRVNVGTAGNGSFTHLPIELVRTATATPITVIPYKGTGPAATDLMGHTLDAMVEQITTALGLASTAPWR